jgi:DNA modification methylase
LDDGFAAIVQFASIKPCGFLTFWIWTWSRTGDPPMPMEQIICNIAPELKGRLVRLDEISEDPANLRLHGSKSIEAIKASYRRFGQQKPIVIDAAGVVLAGNGQLRAARDLGWTHIAAVRTDLAGVERVGFAIADNRTAELSNWDDDALSRTLLAMPEDLVGDTGFTSDDLAGLAASALEAEQDEVPEPAPTAIAKRGETWLLGDHRLTCGDSTSIDDVRGIMRGEKAALVSTDPPYLVDYTGDRPGKGTRKGSGKNWSAVYKEIDHKHAADFLEKVFACVLQVIGEHAAVYCWHAHPRTAVIQGVWAMLVILDHQQIIWVKPNPVFGRMFYAMRHEPCMMGWVKGSKPPHDGGHAHNSVWEISDLKAVDLDGMSKEQLVSMIMGSTSIWEVDWEGKGRVVGNEHPTQKPVEIFARPMRKHTRPGDVVFEPFSGSGSQLIAAEQLGRKCRAIDLQPVFVDVAIRRWQRFTGKAAILEGDGRTWSEIASERSMSSCHISTPAPAASSVALVPPRKASTAKRTKTGKGSRGPARKGQPTAADMGHDGGVSAP